MRFFMSDNRLINIRKEYPVEKAKAPIKFGINKHPFSSNVAPQFSCFTVALLGCKIDPDIKQSFFLALKLRKLITLKWNNSFGRKWDIQEEVAPKNVIAILLQCYWKKQ